MERDEGGQFTCSFDLRGYVMDHTSGYAGIILRVNLSKREITKEHLDAELAAKFIGGRGLKF